jgi:hypothetical protein
VSYPPAGGSLLQSLGRFGFGQASPFLVANPDASRGKRRLPCLLSGEYKHKEDHMYTVGSCMHEPVWTLV